MEKGKYRHSFYKTRHRKTVYSADAVLSIVLKALPEVRSAIDFGCGVGTWLAVLQKMGVGEVMGIDGRWVERELLEIPCENFREGHFEEGVALDRKYDLAISLEVAEHLPEKSAGRFVDSLVAASDFVLFSAAIPFQGGNGHLNEQWPDFWADLFNERGFVTLDFVRRKVWTDRKIPAWYRQNVLLFVRKERSGEVQVPSPVEGENPWPLSLVHPDIFLPKAREMSTVGGGWRLFRRAIRRWIRGKVRKSG